MNRTSGKSLNRLSADGLLGVRPDVDEAIAAFSSLNRLSADGLLGAGDSCNWFCDRSRLVSIAFRLMACWGHDGFIVVVAAEDGSLNRLSADGLLGAFYRRTKPIQQK